MTTSLIHTDVWATITGAAQRTKRRSWVAVAYFGKDGPKLLPLRPGSHLVVDAGEAAVKGGMTCPAALKKLVDNDVQVYSVENLHAKIFVFGSRVFVGSANASRQSARTLVEAMLETSDRTTVAEAKGFVEDLCRHELGPEAIDRLSKMYRPPRVVGRPQDRGRKATRKVQPQLPRVHLAQLTFGEPRAGSEEAMGRGLVVAETRMQHPRKHEVQVFWTNQEKVPYREGDVVVQVFREAGGRRKVAPPGSVVHLKKWPGRHPRVTFVYLEVRARNLRSLEPLARELGEGAEKRLSWGGKVNREFAERLLAAWSD